MTVGSSTGSSAAQWSSWVTSSRSSGSSQPVSAPSRVTGTAPMSASACLTMPTVAAEPPLDVGGGAGPEGPQPAADQLGPALVGLPRRLDLAQPGPHRRPLGPRDPPVTRRCDRARAGPRRRAGSAPVARWTRWRRRPCPPRGRCGRRARAAARAERPPRARCRPRAGPAPPRTPRRPRRRRRRRARPARSPSPAAGGAGRPPAPTRCPRPPAGGPAGRRRRCAASRAA